MPSIVMFFPWPRDLCSDLPHLEWEIVRKLAKKPPVALVFWSGELQAALVGLTDETLYIRGHGSKESDTISPGHSGNHAIKALELALRLQKSGLPKGFRGKIKFYNCQSAYTFGPLAVKFLRHEHFGYTACEYYGYTSSIDQIPSNANGAGTHRYSSEHAAYADYTLGSPHYGKPRTMRASETRLPL